MVRLQEAALPPASKTAMLPAFKPAGTATAAMGFCAAFTALSALIMPAPHWPATQEHSLLVGSTLGQTGRLALFGGNGLALDSMRAMSCAGVRFAFTARINAAIPDTMGAEKLVPRLYEI